MNTDEACRICGSTRSRRVSLYGMGVVCEANANGRDRCREREVRNMIREATIGGPMKFKEEDHGDL